MAKNPNFSLSPKPGEPTKLTLLPRKTPWYIRLHNYDLYITIEPPESDEPPDDVDVPPEEEDIGPEDMIGPEGLIRG